MLQSEIDSRMRKQLHPSERAGVLDRVVVGVRAPRHALDEPQGVLAMQRGDLVGARGGARASVVAGWHGVLPFH